MIESTRETGAQNMSELSDSEEQTLPRVMPHQPVFQLASQTLVSDKKFPVETVVEFLTFMRNYIKWLLFSTSHQEITMLPLIEPLISDFLKGNIPVRKFAHCVRFDFLQSEPLAKDLNIAFGFWAQINNNQEVTIEKFFERVDSILPRENLVINPIPEEIPGEIKLSQCLKIQNPLSTAWKPSDDIAVCPIDSKTTDSISEAIFRCQMSYSDEDKVKSLRYMRNYIKSLLLCASYQSNYTIDSLARKISNEFLRGRISVVDFVDAVKLQNFLPRDHLERLKDSHGIWSILNNNQDVTSKEFFTLVDSLVIALDLDNSDDKENNPGPIVINENSTIVTSLLESSRTFHTPNDHQLVCSQPSAISNLVDFAVCPNTCAPRDKITDTDKSNDEPKSKRQKVNNQPPSQLKLDPSSSSSLSNDLNCEDTITISAVTSTKLSCHKCFENHLCNFMKLACRHMICGNCVIKTDINEGNLCPFCSNLAINKSRNNKAKSETH